MSIILTILLVITLLAALVLTGLYYFFDHKVSKLTDKYFKDGNFATNMIKDMYFGYISWITYGLYACAALLGTLSFFLFF